MSRDVYLTCAILKTVYIIEISFSESIFFIKNNKIKIAKSPYLSEIYKRFKMQENT